MRIIALIQKNKHIKLAGNEKLRIERALPESKDRALLVRDILRAWGNPQPPCHKPPEPDHRLVPTRSAAPSYSLGQGASNLVHNGRPD